MRKTMNILVYMMLAFALVVTPAFATDLSSTKQISVNLVNQDPDPARSGDIVELRISAENTGGTTVNNLDIELIPTYPFTLAEGEDAKKSAGTLKAYQTDGDMKIVKFKVLVDPNAKSGTYDLTIRYYDNSEISYFEKDISIDVLAEQKAEIESIDITDMVPGKKTPITFKITNVGSAPLKDIEFSWQNSDNIILPVGSDNTKYIKSLAIGESTEIEYNAIADTNADPGLYLLTLTLSYYDDSTGTDTEINTQAGIYVGGGTDFEVAFTDESDGELTFTVANTGSNTAYSVTASIPEQAGYTITGPRAEIIGNLNNGDYTMVSFTVSKTQQATEDLKVDIIYTDTKGERQTVTRTVDMDSSSSSSVSFPTGMTGTGTDTTTGTTSYRTRGAGGMSSGFSNLTTMAVTAAKYGGILAVLVLGYLYWRHKKKKNELRQTKTK